MNTQQQQELERYPKYKAAYLMAFEKMLARYDDPTRITWKTAEDVYQWWIGDKQ